MNSFDTAKNTLSHLVWASIATIVLFVAAWNFRTAVAALNLGFLYTGDVTFTTGAMIAIFLAIINSDDVRMGLLRKHKQARSIYAIVIADLAVVVASGLLVSSTLSNKDVTRLDLLSLAIMVIFTGSIIRMIFRLVTIILP